MGDHGRPRSIGALLGTVEDLLDTAPRDAKVSSDRRESRARRVHVHHRPVPIGERSRERQARERILGPEAPLLQCPMEVRHALGAHIDYSEKVLLGEGAGLTDRRDPGAVQGGQGAGSEDEAIERDFPGVPSPSRRPVVHPPRPPLSGWVRHLGTLEPTHVTKVGRLGSAHRVAKRVRGLTGDVPRPGPSPGGCCHGQLTRHRGMGEVWAISDPLDADGNRVGRECPEVLDVSAEHDAARFGSGHDDGVHGGAAPGQVAELTCATGERRW